MPKLYPGTLFLSLRSREGTVCKEQQPVGLRVPVKGAVPTSNTPVQNSLKNRLVTQFRLQPQARSPAPSPLTPPPPTTPLNYNLGTSMLRCVLDGQRGEHLVSEHQVPKEPPNQLTAVSSEGRSAQKWLFGLRGSGPANQPNKQKQTLCGDCSSNTTIPPPTNCAQSEFWILE